jgi:hypothetical protein
VGQRLARYEELERQLREHNVVERLKQVDEDASFWVAWALNMIQSFNEWTQPLLDIPMHNVEAVYRDLDRLVREGPQTQFEMEGDATLPFMEDNGYVERVMLEFTKVATGATVKLAGFEITERGAQLYAELNRGLA